MMSQVLQDTCALSRSSSEWAPGRTWTACMYVPNGSWASCILPRSCPVTGGGGIVIQCHVACCKKWASLAIDTRLMNLHLYLSKFSVDVKPMDKAAARRPSRSSGRAWSPALITLMTKIILFAILMFLSTAALVLPSTVRRVPICESCTAFSPHLDLSLGEDCKLGLDCVYYTPVSLCRRSLISSGHVGVLRHTNGPYEHIQTGDIQFLQGQEIVAKDLEWLSQWYASLMDSLSI